MTLVFGYQENEYRLKLFTVDPTREIKPGTMYVVQVPDKDARTFCKVVSEKFEFLESETEIKRWFGIAEFPAIIGEYEIKETIW